MYNWVSSTYWGYTSSYLGKLICPVGFISMFNRSGKCGTTVTKCPHLGEPLRDPPSTGQPWEWPMQFLLHLSHYFFLFFAALININSNDYLCLWGGLSLSWFYYKYSTYLIIELNWIPGKWENIKGTILDVTFIFLSLVWFYSCGGWLFATHWCN